MGREETKGVRQEGGGRRGEGGGSREEKGGMKEEGEQGKNASAQHARYRMMRRTGPRSDRGQARPGAPPGQSPRSGSEPGPVSPCV